MLRIITKEQKDRIEEILGDTSIWMDDYGDGIHIDDWVSYDKLAELVDYLRSKNEKIATKNSRTSCTTCLTKDV